MTNPPTCRRVTDASIEPGHFEIKPCRCRKGSPFPTLPQGDLGGVGGGSGVGSRWGSGASSGPRRLFNRPRAVQESFLPPTKASRSVPRCFQRASGGFMCPGRAPRPHFGSISVSKRTPLHFKNGRILSDVHQILKLCAFRLESPFELDFGPSRAPL